MNTADTARMLCTTMVGRADLLRCLDYYSVNELADAGPLFGFIVREEKPQPEKVTFDSVFVGSMKEPAPVETEHPEPVIQFLRVKAQKWIKEDEQSVNLPDWAQVPAPYTDDDLRSDKGTKELKPIPLAPWRREWPFLRAACGKKTEIAAIDCDRLIKIIASRRVLRKIPRRSMLGWTHSCQVLLDFDFRLFPFWGDMRRVAGELAAMRHKSGLQVLVFESNRLTTCRNYLDRKQRSFPYTLPEPGSAVLVLSDLGLYADDDAVKQKWALLGKRLGEHGLKPVALLPCPPRLWNDDIYRYWYPVYWDWGGRLPDSESKIARDFKVPAHQDDAVDRTADLLTALSPSVLVEPALMRAVRVRLPGKRMDVGTEGDVWNHRHVKSCTLGFAIVPSQRQQLQEQFRMLPESTRTGIFEQIERHHTYLPRVIQFEETLNRHFLTGGELSQAEEFLKKLFDSLEISEFKEQDGLSLYLHRMYDRLDKDIWTGNDRAVALFLKLHMKEIQQGKNIPVLNGIELARFQWLFKNYRQVVRSLLMQRGTELLIETLDAAQKSAGDFPEGFPLVDFETILPTVHLVTDSGVCRSIPVSQRSIPAAIPDAPRFSLLTESSEVVLEKITKPPWATGIGREWDDLFVTLPDRRTLHWFNPGRYSVMFKAQSAFIDIRHGFWWDEQSMADWRENTFGNLDWADFAGKDEHGVYADFSVGKVTQRLRWIWPGTFLMGSPESCDDESQHEVTISGGFWLAEAACTQALWQEIMGKNPSRFKGENLPVEMVSWKGCQKFIQAINERKPGLDLRLPTEAEWEYACRAGTETPFSFGVNISPEQVNYDGNYPYHRGGQGEYRKKTVAVKSLLCNEWGLYEMHGNVWEWCCDWKVEYPYLPVVDPVGPDTGSVRVLRGGSWVSIARLCRSACRFHRGPFNRFDDIGFRLARGQSHRMQRSGKVRGGQPGSGAIGGQPPNKERGGDGGSWLSKIKKWI